MWVLIAVLTSGSLLAGLDQQEIGSAEDVVAKFVQAVGGREKLAEQRSMRKVIEVVMPDGSKASAVQEFRKPGMIRVELTLRPGTTFVQTYDGSDAWSMNTGQSGITRTGPGSASLLAAEAEFEGPLVDYASKGHRVELIGRERLGDQLVYHLEVLREGSSGNAEHHYLDAETFLPVRELISHTIEGQTSTRTRTLSDYRQVDGVMLAHRVEERWTGAGEAVVYTLQNAEFNVDLADDRFRLQAADNPDQERIPLATIQDDPAARQRYGAMIAALRQADTLTFESSYSVIMGGRARADCTYKLWMKKPNQYRMEAYHPGGELSGVLVGDGSVAWIYWPNGRPRIPLHEDPVEHESSRFNVYLTKPSPLAHHSIAHDAGLLGTGMVMTVFELSTFHGFTDGLQPTINAIGGSRTETIGDEVCDVVEVSFMDGQRSWELWIARSDQLPRRLRETVRAHQDLIAEEHWTKLRVDDAIEDELFVWTPPAGWREWRRPDAGTRLLAAGTPAPDFNLELASGGRQRLADLRGEVVMLVFWRAG